MDPVLTGVLPATPAPVRFQRFRIKDPSDSSVSFFNIPKDSVSNFIEESTKQGLTPEPVLRFKVETPDEIDPTKIVPAYFNIEPEKVKEFHESLKAQKLFAVPAEPPKGMRHDNKVDSLVDTIKNFTPVALGGNAPSSAKAIEKKLGKIIEQKQIDVVTPAPTEPVKEEKPLVPDWIKEGAKDTVSELWKGLQKDAVYFYGNLSKAEADILRPVADAFDYYANKAGMKEAERKNAIRVVVNNLQGMADDTKGAAEEVGKPLKGEELTGAIAGGFGQLPVVLPAIQSLIARLGPAGMAAYNAYVSAPSGDIKQVAKSATAGAALQASLGATAALPMALKVPAQATMFGGVTAAEGGDLNETLAAAILGGTFAATSTSPKYKEFAARINEIAKPIVESDWYRGLDLRARQAVGQSVSDQIKSMQNNGMSKGEIIRELKRSGVRQAFDQANKNRGAGSAADVVAPVTSPEVTPATSVTLKPPAMAPAPSTRSNVTDTFSVPAKPEWGRVKIIDDSDPSLKVVQDQRGITHKVGAALLVSAPPASTEPATMIVVPDEPAPAPVPVAPATEPAKLVPVPLNEKTVEAAKETVEIPTEPQNQIESVINEKDSRRGFLKKLFGAGAASALAPAEVAAAIITSVAGAKMLSTKNIPETIGKVMGNMSPPVLDADGYWAVRVPKDFKSKAIDIIKSAVSKDEGYYNPLHNLARDTMGQDAHVASYYSGIADKLKSALAQAKGLGVENVSEDALQEYANELMINSRVYTTEEEYRKEYPDEPIYDMAPPEEVGNKIRTKGIWWAKHIPEPLLDLHIALSKKQSKTTPINKTLNTIERVGDAYHRMYKNPSNLAYYRFLRSKGVSADVTHTLLSTLNPQDFIMAVLADPESIKFPNEWKILSYYGEQHIVWHAMSTPTTDTYIYGNGAGTAVFKKTDQKVSISDVLGLTKSKPKQSVRPINSKDVILIEKTKSLRSEARYHQGTIVEDNPKYWLLRHKNKTVDKVSKQNYTIFDPNKPYESPLDQDVINISDKLLNIGATEPVKSTPIVGTAKTVESKPVAPPKEPVDINKINSLRDELARRQDTLYPPPPTGPLTPQEKLATDALAARQEFVDKNPASRVTVDGKEIGQFTVDVNPDTPKTATLNNVEIYKKFRGKGHLPALVKQATDEALQKGADTLDLVPADDSPKLIKAYGEQGFVLDEVTGRMSKQIVQPKSTEEQLMEEYELSPVGIGSEESQLGRVAKGEKDIFMGYGDTVAKAKGLGLKTIEAGGTYFSFKPENESKLKPKLDWLVKTYSKLNPSEGYNDRTIEEGVQTSRILGYTEDQIKEYFGDKFKPTTKTEAITAQATQLVEAQKQADPLKRTVSPEISDLANGMTPDEVPQTLPTEITKPTKVYRALYGDEYSGYSMYNVWELSEDSVKSDIKRLIEGTSDPKYKERYVNAKIVSIIINPEHVYHMGNDGTVFLHNGIGEELLTGKNPDEEFKKNLVKEVLGKNLEDIPVTDHMDKYSDYVVHVVSHNKYLPDILKNGLKSGQKDHDVKKWGGASTGRGIYAWLHTNIDAIDRFVTDDLGTEVNIWDKNVPIALIIDDTNLPKALMDEDDILDGGPGETHPGIKEDFYRYDRESARKLERKLKMLPPDRTYEQVLNLVDKFVDDNKIEGTYDAYIGQGDRGGRGRFMVDSIPPDVIKAAYAITPDGWKLIYEQIPPSKSVEPAAPTDTVKVGLARPLPPPPPSPPPAPEDPVLVKVRDGIKAGTIPPNPSRYYLQHQFRVGATRADRILSVLDQEKLTQKRTPSQDVDTKRASGETDIVESVEPKDFFDSHDEPPLPEPSLKVLVDNIDFSKPVGELPEAFGSIGWRVERTPEGITVAYNKEGKRFFVRGTALYVGKGESKNIEGVPEAPTATVKHALFDNEILDRHAGPVVSWARKVMVSPEIANNIMLDDVVEYMITKLDLKDAKNGIKNDPAVLADAKVELRESLEKYDPDQETTTFNFPDQLPSSSPERGDKPEDPIFGTPLNAPPTYAQMQMDTTSTIGNVKKPVSHIDVIKEMESTLNEAGSPSGLFRGKRIRGKNAGQYKAAEDIVRLRESENVPIASHELFHALLKAVTTFPTIRAAGIFNSNRTIVAELINMGKNLYGNNPPAGGYSTEGWAEFGRNYLTTNDRGASVAPETLQWFDGDFKNQHPAAWKKVNKVRDSITKYRKQGDYARMKSMIVPSTSSTRDFINKLKKAVSIKEWVENADTLEKIVSLYNDLYPDTPLSPSHDPYQTFSALRMSHHGTVRGMIEDGMRDFAGNVVSGPLEDVTNIIKSKREEFTVYAMAKRAKDYEANNKRTGFNVTDLDALIGGLEMDSPELAIAHAKLKEWTDGVLNYATQSGLIDTVTRQKMMDKGTNYVPFLRVMEESELPAFDNWVNENNRGIRGSNPMKRVTGGGKRVKDVFPALVHNTTRLIKKANEHYALKTMLDLSKIDGMGGVVEEVPVSQVPDQFKIENIKKQLEDLGIDVSGVDMDELLTVFSPASFPSGQDPIIPFHREGKTHWYRVPREAYDMMMENEIYRLPFIADLLVGMPMRAVKMGVTSFNAAFSLIKNPTRDVASMLMQTSTEASMPELFFGWIHNLVREAIPGVEKSEGGKLFKRLGGEMSLPLAMDTNPMQRTIDRLFRGKLMRVITSPIDTLRNILQIPENVSRATEVDALLKEAGIRPGQPITLDQSISLLLAGKRVTTDFTAAGSSARKLNQVLPFFNPQIQGARTFFRAFKEHPYRSILRGLTSITIPTLYLWWLNKDKKWYTDMPHKERYTYYHIQNGQEIINIAKPFEWGTLFSTFPEATLDSWYREDPTAVKEALGYAFEQLSPFGTPKNPNLPVPAKVGLEQAMNKVGFTGASIVPEGQKNFAPGDQVGPYTSGLAKYLGQVFPGQVSPRRIDHAIRGFFGGVGQDVVNLFGGQNKTREPEPSDTFVLGTLFRRGGTHSPSSLAVDKLYDEMNQIAQAEQQDIKNVKKPSLETIAYRLAVRDAIDWISFVRNTYNETSSRVARNNLQEGITQVAENALSLKGKKLNEIIPFRVKLGTSNMSFQRKFKERDLKLDMLRNQNVEREED